MLHELTDGQFEIDISTEAGRIAVLPRSGDSFRLGTASVAVCMLRRRLLCLLSIVSVLGLPASPAGGTRDPLDHSRSNTVNPQYMYCHNTILDRIAAAVKSQYTFCAVNIRFQLQFLRYLAYRITNNTLDFSKYQLSAQFF